MRNLSSLNKPLAFHLAAMDISPLPPCRRQGKQLPERLVIPPGTYNVHGRNYCLAKEGLYRFLNPGISNHQRIVFSKDVWLFAASTSWLATHGKRDDGKGDAELEAIACREKQVLTCGYISMWACNLFREHGVPARVVHGRALDNLNDYNISHTLLEIGIAGKWTLCDLDRKRCFKRRGRRISMLEAGDAFARDDYQPEPLSKAAMLAASDFRGKNNYDYGLWGEISLADEQSIRRWFRRIMTLQITTDSDGVYFATGQEQLRRQARRIWPDLKHISQADFYQRFYSKPPA